MKLLLKKAMVCAGIALVLWSCKKDPVDNDPLLSVPPVQMAHVSSVIQFGADLGGKENPAFEYILYDGFESVLAAEEGHVDAVVKNTEFDDYEIRITLNPSWMIIYDHVTNPVVAAGDTVLAGQLLGNVGEGNRFELQINYKDGKSYCPFEYASAAFVNAHKDFTENWCIKDAVTSNNKK